jgi:hypothetical protein
MRSSTIVSSLLLGALPLALSSEGPGDCTGIKAISPKCSSRESAHHRDTFYIGGGYVDSGIPGQQMWSDSLYVEKLTPANKVNKPYPMVFISAGVNTGAEWLNTPDNRKGWASYYLDQGYQVYVVDIAANGRSGQQLLSKYPLRIGSTDIINGQGFLAPEHFDQYPQADLHTQWPGNGSRGDPVFDAFTAANVPISSSNVAVENTMRTSGCQLLSMIGQSYTVCHSAACTYTAIWSDACPDLLRANINIEPGNLPFTSLIGNTTVAGVGCSAVWSHIHSAAVRPTSVELLGHYHRRGGIRRPGQALLYPADWHDPHAHPAEQSAVHHDHRRGQPAHHVRPLLR